MYTYHHGSSPYVIVGYDDIHGLYPDFVRCITSPLLFLKIICIFCTDRNCKVLHNCMLHTPVGSPPVCLRTIFFRDLYIFCKSFSFFLYAGGSDGIGEMECSDISCMILRFRDRTPVSEDCPFVCFIFTLQCIVDFELGDALHTIGTDQN